MGQLVTEMKTERLAVSVRDVHKSYGGGGSSTHVLRGVHLDIPSGQCIFLAGPSGSGKTTLLSILGCILRADRGAVRLFDEDVGSLAERERVMFRSQRIGFVFQRFHLIRGLTALENVAVPLTLQRRSRRETHLRARQLLADVGLGDLVHAHPSRLSTGQCQRVALARALVTNPDVILADEPTASLDEENGRSVMRLLRSLTTDLGKTAIIVTHDPRIYRFADRICHMEHGVVVDQPLQTESIGGSPVETDPVGTDQDELSLSGT